MGELKFIETNNGHEVFIEGHYRNHMLYDIHATLLGDDDIKYEYSRDIKYEVYFCLDLNRIEKIAIFMNDIANVIDWTKQHFAKNHETIDKILQGAEIFGE